MSTAWGAASNIVTFGTGAAIGAPGQYFMTPVVGGTAGMVQYVTTTPPTQVTQIGLIQAILGGAAGGASIDYEGH